MRTILAAIAMLGTADGFGLSVTVISPTNGTSTTGGEYWLQAVATDAEYAVTRVEYLVNGVNVGQSSTPPFSVLALDLDAGTYRIVARAHNTAFHVRDSPPIYARVGNPPLQIARGPYLQSGSPTNLVVRWRTDWFADSVVRFGTNPAALIHARTNPAPVIDHEVNLTGLEAGVIYHYSVGTSAQTLAGGSNCYFRAAPLAEQPVRIWVIGDAGTSDRHQTDVRNAYYAATAGAPTDLLLMLGDNAYGEGFDHEYQRAVFDMYRDLLRHTPVWPTLGNHDAGDAYSPLGNEARDYLEIFTLPAQGESGGLPSGTELYYSFDYANIHVVCLDSFLSDNSPGGPMLTWLRHDLEQTDKDWIIAFWHHPPYSFGTHESDGDYYLANMRERALPILEDYGADLVLSGHSHNYERSMLLDGHYGPSWTLQPGMILNSGFGRTNLDGAYLKPAGGVGSHRGCVYAVCGCSGEGGLAEGFPLHPAMKLNHGGYGSMILEINGLRMKAQFLRDTGEVDDSFTIDKSLDVTNPPALAITREPSAVVVSWPTSKPAFSLHSTPAIPGTNWLPADVAMTNGRRRFLTNPFAGEKRFYQLRGAGP